MSAELEEEQGEREETAAALNGKIATVKMFKCPTGVDQRQVEPKKFYRKGEGFGFAIAAGQEMFFRISDCCAIRSGGERDNLELLTNRRLNPALPKQGEELIVLETGTDRNGRTRITSWTPLAELEKVQAEIANAPSWRVVRNILVNNKNKGDSVLWEGNNPRGLSRWVIGNRSRLKDNRRDPPMRGIKTVVAHYHYLQIKNGGGWRDAVTEDNPPISLPGH